MKKLEKDVIPIYSRSYIRPGSQDNQGQVIHHQCSQVVKDRYFQLNHAYKVLSAVNQVKSLCGAYTGSVNPLSLKQIIRHNYLNKISSRGSKFFGGGGRQFGESMLADGTNVVFWLLRLLYLYITM